MASYRRSRINDAVAQETAIALRDVRDPRIVDAFVSISRAEVTSDLKSAKIFYSCMGDSTGVAEALKRAAGLFRRHLAVSLNLRITPELSFYEDKSIEHGARIAKILHDISSARKVTEDSEDEFESDESDGDDSVEEDADNE